MFRLFGATFKLNLGGCVVCVCVCVCVCVWVCVWCGVCVCVYKQGIHKRMVRFLKLTINLFLTLHGHNVHRQQQQMFQFLMRYQQFACHAYCGTAGPVCKMASQQEKAFCVLRFEVSRSVITVQCEFRARFRKDAPARCSKHEKRTTGSAWETWTVAAADGVRCVRVRWEINLELTFETAPFFCVYPVCVCMCVYIYIYNGVLIIS